jgi:tetratricopeptide (TPR) repeat protein
MEAAMTGKVKGRRIETGCFAFGSGFVFVFTLALLSLYCTLSLVGCNSGQTASAKVDRARSIPAAARKAELLKELERKFENPPAHFELAQLYQAEGLLQKAEYHYNVALTFDPVLTQAQAAMVKLFLESGDAAKSKTYADVYVNQASGSAVQSLRLAMAFQKEGLDEYALTCYQQALNLAPNSARIHKQIGYYYLSKGDKAQAKEYLVRSFQLDPNQPEVAGELGRLGVEVRIPQKTDTSAKKLEKPAAQGSEQKKEWKISSKQGLFQVEPVLPKKVQTK